LKKIVKTNLVLIGAGPIGIEMAAALKTSNIEYIHLEAGCLASTINWYAPGTPFFSSPERLSIAGIPLETYPHFKITREEYLLYLRSVVVKFNLQISFFSKVQSITTNLEQEFEITVTKSPTGVGGPRHNELRTELNTSSTRHLLAKKIIFAIGDMHHPKYLEIEGENGPFVSHFLPDPHSLSFMKVAIVGGKNSAVEAAIRLYRAGAKVTLIHRRANFDPKKVKPWLLPELKALIREGKIEIEMETKVIKIDENTVSLKKTNDDAKPIKKIDCDYTLLLTGYAQDSSLFEQTGIKLTGKAKKPEINNETNETNVKNAFIIGTAVAGTQIDGAKHFIETGHIHINRVLRKLGIKEYPLYSGNIRNEDEREN